MDFINKVKILQIFYKMNTYISLNNIMLCVLIFNISLINGLYMCIYGVKPTIYAYKQLNKKFLYLNYKVFDEIVRKK